jgi:hypothetical protein
MTWFNFLKKDVVVHCYTSQAPVFNYAPIQNSSVFIPQWWKKLPKSYNTPNSLFEAPTMKGCIGFTDLYKQGFMLPIWCDVKIEIGSTGLGGYRYHFSGAGSSMTSHAQMQRGDAFCETEYQHLKINSPWIFECSEDIKFVQLEPFWNNPTPETMSVMPGVLDFKYQHGANVNTLWKRQSETKIYQLDFGQPLAQFIPLTERNVNFELHLISAEELQHRRSISFSTTFINKFRNNRRVLQQRGCPFHFKAEK